MALTPPANLFTAPLVSNAEVFHASKLTFNLDPPLFENEALFVTPKLVFTLEPPLFANANTVYSHARYGFLAVDLFVDPDVFFEGETGQILRPPLYADEDTFYGPGQTNLATITLDLIAPGASFYVLRIFSINPSRTAVAQRPCDPDEGRTPSPSERDRTIFTRRPL